MGSLNAQRLVVDEQPLVNQFQYPRGSFVHPFSQCSDRLQSREDVYVPQARESPLVIAKLVVAPRQVIDF